MTQAADPTTSTEAVVHRRGPSSPVRPESRLVTAVVPAGTAAPIRVGPAGRRRRRRSAPRPLAHWSRAIATAAFVLFATGCSADEGADTAPSVASAAPTDVAPTDEVERPVSGTELEPGTRYRFADILPGLVDVELTAPEPPLYNQSAPTLAQLSPDPDGKTDALVILAASEILVQRDPYVFPDLMGDPAAAMTTPPVAPVELLSYFSQLPFVEVTTPERTFGVGGVDGRAIDLRIRDLPPEAEACAEFMGIPRCAGTIYMPAAGTGFVVEPGQSIRFIEVELPNGPVLIQQNLDLPAAQAALDGLTFLEA